MVTLAEIQKQIEALQAQAQSIIEAEKSGVIEDMKAKILQYGITANELGFSFKSSEPSKAVKASGAGTSKAPSVPMYKNPEGETWHGGKGARPKWIQAIFDKQVESNKDFNQADLHKFLEDNGYKI